MLYKKLKEYSTKDVYPMHMPGHKRNAGLFGEVESIDFTEVEGLDNLHDPEGILKESMDKTSEILGIDKTYYLVNGSTSGILAAVQCATDIGDNIIIGRNPFFYTHVIVYKL